MTILKVRHRTTYSYAQPVMLQPHRLLLRPRDSIMVRVLSCDITISPAASVVWSSDVMGNALAVATFATMSDHLVIESTSVLESSALPWPVFDIAYEAALFPFAYAPDDQTDLAPLRAAQYPDPSGRLRVWARNFIARQPTDTLSLLKDLNLGLARWISYQSRDDEGTQSPLETIDRGFGSCRDYAVLFVEAARSLGFAARLVSGYLNNPEEAAFGAGSTHAWGEVFLPGAGWIAFDPTNSKMGGFNLVPVAVGRSMNQVMPVTGSFVGMSNAYRGMQVTVDVSELSHAPA